MNGARDFLKWDISFSVLYARIIVTSQPPSLRDFDFLSAKASA
jgi:hypothetical protein